MTSLRLVLAAAVLGLPRLVAAQQISVDAQAQSAERIRAVLARPHRVITGSGDFIQRRDSAITSSVLIIGRPAFLAGPVAGDVVVVGNSLFLRPGVAITGRAVAIGGSVAPTSLGTVGGGIESYRDESYTVRGDGTAFALERVAYDDETIPLFQPAGIKGVKIPSYDRVDGLSLPVGVELNAGVLRVEPAVTYRSRLGAFDPSSAVTLNPERAPRFEGRVGVETRTNEDWIYHDLINSALFLANGSDIRNYFRSRIVEGRLIGQVAHKGYVLEPWVGVRGERTSSISAAGNVFTFRNRTELEHGARFNPPVDEGGIGSALLGARFNDMSGVVISRLDAGVEQSFLVPGGRSQFLQLTLDGRIQFPTFREQQLRIDAHAVTTAGSATPRARYAYLGGSGTLPLLDVLEQGGDELIYVESRYLIPFPAIVLPLVGSPRLTLRHLLGGAGIGGFPTLEQEVGAGIGLSVLRLDVTTDASGGRGTKFGIGISFSQ